MRLLLKYTYIPKSVQNIWKSGNNNQMNSNQEIKPFVAFGKEDAEGGDLGESSMKGVNFYQQYGQHDDRQDIFVEIIEISSVSKR